MDALYQAGKATAAEIRAAMPDPYAYSPKGQNYRHVSEVRRRGLGQAADRAFVPANHGSRTYHHLESGASEAIGAIVSERLLG